MQEYTYSYDGFCTVCEQNVTFRSSSRWFRDHLRCPNCDSLVRERALALILNEQRPDWRHLSIHESSPADRGISRKMRLECRDYVQTQFFPDQRLGEIIKGYRNENLENQTFDDELFDIVITLDVMEHVFNPEVVYKEVFRTLKPGGIYLHTFPVSKALVEGAKRRAVLQNDGIVRHLVDKPSYHGNPIDNNGSLVTFDYGYDISKYIAVWADFDVRVIRFWSQGNGIIGDYTEVFLCSKRNR